MHHLIILKNIATVIRTWSNNADIVKAVKRAIDAGIGRVIVVVKDDSPEHFGNVETLLAGLIEANADRVSLLPMRVGYCWSNALNYGFDEVRRLNLGAAVRGTPAIDYVLNVSNEALYSREDVLAMVKEMSSDEKIGAVGTSFQGQQSGNPVELGKSYVHPRNTMMLVRFAAYQAIGGYSPRCDQLGGQEDLDWLIRLAQMGHRWSMLDLKVKLLIGKNHDQAVKQAREEKAIMAITAEHAGITLGLTQLLIGLQ